jgi:hypothetical protein
VGTAQGLAISDGDGGVVLTDIGHHVDIAGHVIRCARVEVEDSVSEAVDLGNKSGSRRLIVSVTVTIRS